MIKIVISARGKEQVVDQNGYKYYFNNKAANTKYFICSQAGCNVRLTTTTAGELVGDSLPDHHHGTNLLKRMAKEIQTDVVMRFATLPSTTTKQATGKMSKQMLASGQPDALFSMGSDEAVKAALWREKKKLTSQPKLPKTYKEIMEMEIPDKYKNTADDSEFLAHHNWLNQDKKEAVLLFISDFGADILRRAEIGRAHV